MGDGEICKNGSDNGPWVSEGNKARNKGEEVLLPFSVSVRALAEKRRGSVSQLLHDAATLRARLDPARAGTSMPASVGCNENRNDAPAVERGRITPIEVRG